MDNNFSAQVKEVISYSREEALRLGNDFIGAEHLLLGILRDGENHAIKILENLNVDLFELRKEIELAVKNKSGNNITQINSLPLTKQAERVIRITVIESKAWKSPMVETEHLLLSILKLIRSGRTFYDITQGRTRRYKIKKYEFTSKYLG